MINKYQKAVSETDQFKDDVHRSIQISFKNIRREIDYIQQRVSDEVFNSAENALNKKDWKECGFENRIGDILWYVTNLSNHFDLKLDEILNKNQKKIDALYISKKSKSNSSIQIEKLPTNLEVGFIDAGKNRLLLLIKLENGEFLQIGDTIDDNSHDDDDYRYHDVFHFSYLAYLDWSPVLRSLFRRKRKSIPVIDRVEDGARAAILEEAISAIVFERAKKDSKYFEGSKKVDFELLDIIKGMTVGLEVGSVHHKNWEKAIIEGFKVFRKLKESNGGIVQIKKGNLIFKNIDTDISFKSIQDEILKDAHKELEEVTDEDLKSVKKAQRV